MSDSHGVGVDGGGDRHDVAGGLDDVGDDRGREVTGLGSEIGGGRKGHKK